MGNHKTIEDEQEYVLGTDDSEIARLAFQHEVWLSQAAEGWERAGFKAGDCLIDVGCGPGNATFNLSNIVGETGKVYSIDLSRRYISHLRSGLRQRGIDNVIAKVGNVEKLDVPNRSADGAFARWVLCFTPNPKAVIADVGRTLKPGGVFLVHDYYRYEGFAVAPKNEIIEYVFSRIAESFRQQGGHPDIAGDLPEILSDNGFIVQDIKLLTRLARPKTLLWKWLELFFKTYIPKLVDKSLITFSEQKAFEKEFGKLTNNSLSFLSTPSMVEIIGIKK